ncbi:hypothetical protein FJU30_08400 [Affinibrenneria salicis]|uniref:Uncharacterized protein n=1 Tax=Affinibrenneria salicis TaxID=2590031 RepID=A0A5J5G333_9GAMM|nr:hypothetical protein [Affinibrenneria salicis]KAA9001249.1 hypothetical protein FJU30_08400 [Affinibrenneria salicis]
MAPGNNNGTNGNTGLLLYGRRVLSVGHWAKPKPLTSGGFRRLFKGFRFFFAKNLQREDFTRFFYLADRPVWLSVFKESL